MRPCSPFRWHRCAVVIAGLLFAGCVVSPQPEPPSIDGSLLSIASNQGTVTLSGAPGAVKPGSSTLDALDLDAKAAPSSLTVAADGSFSVALTGAVDDAFRLQAFSGGLRSEPLDLQGHMGLMGGATLGPASRPLASCFSLTPALEIATLAPSTSATVVMTNDCTDPVTVGGVSLRLGSPAFTITPASAAQVIPAQSSRSFTVTFTPHPGDAVEDIVFVQIDAPESGRLPLTVRGESP
jgi:hypothetical protein